jgi:modulator of FtsH protease HflK
MGWNESDNDNDPWRGKSPPDIDEVLKRFHAKLKKAMGGQSTSTPPEKKTSPQGNVGRFGILFGGIVFLLWVLSGIFIVDPAEQAVILRFGKYVETVGPGPHWIPRFIESKIVANVERVSDYSYAAQMLTKDENLVAVSLVVQYRIGDLQAYLFNVADPEESLEQATSSALRQVVGSTRLDQIITEGREAWGSSVQETLSGILAGYNTGIMIVNVSPQPARAPENVQDAFDDAIKAQEDEKRFKEQARAYEASVVPIAEGNAKRILEESRAFEAQVVLRAEGEVAEFLAVLPEYERAPKVTSERMYIDAIQRVMQQTSKIIVDGKAGNMLYLPLDKWSISHTEQTIPVPMRESPIKTAGTSETDSALLGGRETVRRLEPVGRGDS